MVSTGGADLAVMPVSEILHAARVDFAGSLPLEIQFVQVFFSRRRGGLARDSKLQTANRIFYLGTRCRGNSEKWNGAARELELAARCTITTNPVASGTATGRANTRY
jgi:hypothetical protein